MWIFFITSIVVLAGIVLFMPKHLSKIELYISYFFILIFTWSVNVVIDAKYDMRGFFQKGPDYPTMLIFLFVFSCLGLVLLNYYPYKQSSVVKKMIYIILGVLVFFAYELLLIKNNILYYNNWNYIYSIFLYTGNLLLFLLNKKIIKYL